MTGQHIHSASWIYQWKVSYLLFVFSFNPYTTVWIKNCSKSTSVIKVATIKCWWFLLCITCNHQMLKLFLKKFHYGFFESIWGRYLKVWFSLTNTAPLLLGIIEGGLRVILFHGPFHGPASINHDMVVNSPKSCSSKINYHKHK